MTETVQFGSKRVPLAAKQALVNDVRTDGYNINDRGLKNDSDVNGPASDPHSWDLGANAGFRPSLMPGTIVETLFLSNPGDLAYIRRTEALDVIASGQPKMLEFGVADETAWNVGLSCGGTIKVFVEKVG